MPDHRAAGAVVPTPHGHGRLVVVEAHDPVATLLLSHGAGNGIESHDLAALMSPTTGLPARGITVAGFDQPWRVAGKKIATAPPTLDVGLRAAAASLAARGPLVVGGRSAGARSAARCAVSLDAVGCLAISFPLHPPGRPERSRLDELAGVGVPTLVVQGERDAMGRPEEFPELAGVRLVVVPWGDHGLRVAKAAPLTLVDVHALLVDAVADWTRRLVGNP
jgi:predicted alpha/beta-hydrolase family hydrolase